ncbi:MULTISPECIES: DUF6193 family natural product biosynthesis protein [Kitasatospora]|uniref:Uncharacterized protein n=1 Tax=Kitasatospora setae (strain ATCC 33774 / DSM 43861 / JCM 3304 / KCC A-0304 / NBRC 14216 / KM-6054) TaxID=452652 RepID=E4N132_KITSK|nr:MULTISPECIES: DUF6193 family natural product biosynthesis protein [Kitasatospora]BAJ31866.1 hypothetical protein KSE_61000 [Kitasatospora setae KM-6054]
MDFEAGDGGDGVTLGEVLLRAAAGLGIVLPEPEELWDGLAVYVVAGLDRGMRVSADDERRRAYWVHLRSGGLRLAAGSTADPAELVRALAAWAGGAGLAETRARAPFVEFRPWALAHEREPLDTVELAWCRLLDRFHTPPMNRFVRARALVAAAYARPVLRRLMPVTSHGNLWFSTSTTANRRLTGVGPMIWPSYEGSYAVRDGHEVLARFETPEEAVAFVLAGLPEGIGPAR